MLNPHIFRAYDVRGRVGDDINPDVFRLVGAAYGTRIRRRGGRTVAVGRDNRISSADLQAAFIEGARSAGLDVVDVGLTPTPLLYFATAHWQLDGGANITGSHNPIEYNGVKMVHPGAAPLTEEEIQSLRTTIEAGTSRPAGARSPSAAPAWSTSTRWPGVRPSRSSGRGGRGQRRGRALGSRRLAPDRVRCAGALLRVRRSFPNHLPDPEDAENARPAGQVRAVGADLGFASTATPTASA